MVRSLPQSPLLQLTDGILPKIIYIVFIYPYNNGAKYKEPGIDN